MNKSARPLLLCSIAASGLLMLGACGKKHDATTDTPSPAATAAAPAGAPVIPATPASTMPPGSATVAPPPASSSTMMPAPASTSAAATSPADAAAAPFAVSKVTVGDKVDGTHKVSSARQAIAADEKSIYASVETSGKTEGSTLSARWSYLEGKGQLVSAISQSIATEGPAVTTFKIQNPNNWPEGKYKVDIALNGKPVSSQTFQVKSS